MCGHLFIDVPKLNESMQLLLVLIPNNAYAHACIDEDFTNILPFHIPSSGILLPSLNHSYVRGVLPSARQVSSTELSVGIFRLEGLAETISGAPTC